MNMGTHELTAILKKAAVDEGVVTALAPHAKITIGGRLYRQLDLSKYPIGSQEWQDAVDKAAKVTAAPAGGNTGTTGTGTGTGTQAPAPAPDPATATVTAGAPGSFNCEPPENIAALRRMGDLGQTTAWATDEHVQLGTGHSAHWNGVGWASGKAP